jgi:CDP-diacylglycerol--glycerol-3-phosphate 3-phosphatidyltransferase
MILGESTDFFDGFIARKTGQISNTGKIYDPMADSIFHIMIWMSFLSVGWISVWLVILFFVRDSVVSNIRICLASHRVVLAARCSGKIKAAIQAVAQLSLVVLHIFLKGNYLECLQFSVVMIAAGITVYSLGDYIWAFNEVVKRKGTIIE